MNEIFTNLNGYLIRIYLDEQTINLEQFKFASLTKQFQIINRNTIKLDSLLSNESSNLKKYQCKLIKDQNSNLQKNYVSLWLRLCKNDNEYKFLKLIASFNSENSNCCFDLNITKSINSSLGLLNLNETEYLNNVYSKLIDEKNNYAIYLVQKNELKYFMSKTSKWASTHLFKEETWLQIEKIEATNWLEVNVSDDEESELNLANSKTILSLYFINTKNEFTFKSILIETNLFSSCQIMSINIDGFFGPFSSMTAFNLQCLIDRPKVDSTDLNQNNFFPQTDKCMQNIISNFVSTKSTNQYKLEYFKPIDLNLTFNNNLTSSGQAILVFWSSQANASYFVLLENGKIKYSKRFDNIRFASKFQLIQNPIEFDKTKNINYLIMNDRITNQSHYFYLNSPEDEILKKFHIDSEIVDHEILRDFFQIDDDNQSDDSYLFEQFLIIKNWQEKNFKIVSNLSQLSSSLINKLDSHSGAENKSLFNLDLTQDLNELMSLDEDNASINNEESFLVKKAPPINYKKTKQNYANDLLKILKYKEHVSELLLKEAQIECKRKYSLIAEITKFYSNINKSATLFQNDLNLLPKMIELYSSEIKKSTKEMCTFKEQIKCLNNKINFDLKLSWSCFLDQYFMINLVFISNIKANLGELNCLLYSKTDTKQFVQLENSQKYMKLDANISNVLSGDKSVDQNYLESLLENAINKKHLIQNTPVNSINEDDTFLLTLKLEQSCLNNLLHSFPNGFAKLNLHFVPLLTRSPINLEINLFENVSSFTLNETFNLKFLVCFLNERVNSSSHFQAKFKLLNISSKLLNDDILIKKLKFDKISSNLFVCSRQGLLTDCVCLTKNEDCFSQLDYKVQTSLTILSRSFQQISVLISILNETLVKSTINNNISIKLDLADQVDSLLNNLSNELNNLLSVSESPFESLNGRNLIESTIMTDDSVLSLI